MAIAGINGQDFALGTTDEEDWLLVRSMASGLKEPGVKDMATKFVGKGNHLRLVHLERLFDIDPGLADEIEIKAPEEYDAKVHRRMRNFGKWKVRSRTALFARACREADVPLPDEFAAITGLTQADKERDAKVARLEEQLSVVIRFLVEKHDFNLDELNLLEQGDEDEPVRGERLPQGTGDAARPPAGQARADQGREAPDRDGAPAGAAQAPDGPGQHPALSSALQRVLASRQLKGTT